MQRMQLNQEELKDLVNGMPFKWEHCVKVINLGAECNETRKEAVVPWPGIARLSLTSKIEAKLHQSDEVQKLLAVRNYITATITWGA